MEALRGSIELEVFCQVVADETSPERCFARGLTLEAGMKPGGTGGFVISLDFELMWGVRDSKTISRYGKNILGVRQAIPRLLDLFDTYDLACTWATVGFLFFDEKDALLEALPELRPCYADPNLSPYGEIERVGLNERKDPFHFGLSLIREIKARPRQEIATHTFSHFYCLEVGQREDEFRADLDAAVKVAAGEGIRFQSIVFPRNQVNIEYLSACRDRGVIFYRGNETNWLYRSAAKGDHGLAQRGLRLVDAYVNLSGDNGSHPVERDGMANVPSSRFLRPYLKSAAIAGSLKRSRILNAMRRCAEAGTVFHLWFHPHNFGVNQDENFALMQEIAREAVRLRELHGWPSLTMAQAGMVNRPFDSVNFGRVDS
jgi:hypothetical protein